jgi:hypothetical protein
MTWLYLGVRLGDAEILRGGSKSVGPAGFQNPFNSGTSFSTFICCPYTF